jgi:SAM-dependent methyltransferase
MAEFNEIYRRAFYYDIAFRRDVDREVEFILQLSRRRSGRPLLSALELACGPGYHARGLAAKGVATYASDLRPEMIAFARSLADADGVAVEWTTADMRAFVAPRPLDAIITMYDSLDCLLTNEELVDHFRAVGGNLLPGGFYLVEMTHPRDCSPWNYGSFQYSGERDGVRVTIDWAVNGARMNPLTQVSDVETVLRVFENGREQAFHDRARERFAGVQEYRALADLSGALRLASCYGDFDFNQPFDDSPGARRMILIFERAD